MNMGFVLFHTAVKLYEISDNEVLKRTIILVFAAIFCSCILISDVCEEKVIVIGSFILFIISAVQIWIIEKWMLYGSKSKKSNTQENNPQSRMRDHDEEARF